MNYRYVSRVRIFLHRQMHDSLITLCRKKIGDFVWGNEETTVGDVFAAWNVIFRTSGSVNFVNSMLQVLKVQKMTGVDWQKPMGFR